MSTAWERPPEYDDETEPDDFGEDAEVDDECPYCCGSGWLMTKPVATECGECGGTGHSW